MEPDRPAPAVPVQRPMSTPSAKLSVVDAVTEGVSQWWDKSTVGRAATLVLPLAEPYLRPIARRNYQALLLSSAAVGALVSQYPWKSTRTVLKVAGPLLISGVLFEIAKAGIRQKKRP